MNTMTMPGFTAEASLYQTSNHYRFAAGGSLLDDGTTVSLQGCGFVDEIKCGIFVAAGVTGCSLLCVGAVVAGPAAIAACVGCWAAVFPADLFISCRDCIPGWVRDIIGIFESGGSSSGGGGPPPPIPCCPGNKRCCGDCVPLPNGRGMQCDDACIGPGQQCP
jgi:hypothetical protein